MVSPWGHFDHGQKYCMQIRCAVQTNVLPELPSTCRRKMARKRHLRQVFFVLLYISVFSIEGALLQNSECLSEDNYCSRSDICAYVFTFNINGDGSCPDLKQAINKVENIETDITQLGVRIENTDAEIEIMKQEQDNTQQSVHQHFDIISYLLDEVARMSEEIGYTRDAIETKRERIKDLQTRLDEKDERIYLLQNELSKHSSRHDKLSTIKLMSTDTNVIVSTPVPDLSELTVCLWMKSNGSDEKAGLVSYAVTANANEFLLFYRHDVVHLWVQQQLKIDAPPLNDDQWHHVCVTWTSIEGRWRLYLDGTLERAGTGLSGGRAVTGGGLLVLGQDQDSVGGGYDADQAFIGEMTAFNMWSRSLNDVEIAQVAKNCSIGGDVFAWNNIDLHIGGDVSLQVANVC
ncbi:neuronal pentraxin-1-like isoform X2 [Ptychodera flava]|uniref:neuronal pentraxin-1-like isoform X1 n=1 Tax=Ptychodera flava TaxID=63121 RepID=UPI003969D92D